MCMQASRGASGPQRVCTSGEEEQQERHVELSPGAQMFLSQCH